MLYARMSESPFAFLRGSAGVMALDLAGTPASGIRVQACGDAHVGNFGQFATPERNIVFDVNDFDETLSGPFEWDLKRLATSLEVAFRGNGVPEPQRTAAVQGAVPDLSRADCAEYAKCCGRWTSGTPGSTPMRSSRSSPHATADSYDAGISQEVPARLHATLRALSKLTHLVDGHRCFVEDPPLLGRLENTGHEADEVLGMIDGYRASLPDDVRSLFDRFRLVDVARKVVGVGSVGTRCWVGLLEGPSHPSGDPLVLQVKEAQASVLEPYVGASQLPHHGLRVVAGQRLTQAASDIFLGWSQKLKKTRASLPLRAPAVGREGVRRPRRHERREPRAIWSAMRVGARPGARTHRRSSRDQRLPRSQRPLRPSDRQLRDHLRRSDRGRSRRTARGDR